MTGSGATYNVAGMDRVLTLVVAVVMAVLAGSCDDDCPLYVVGTDASAPDGAMVDAVVADVRTDRSEQSATGNIRWIIFPICAQAKSIGIKFFDIDNGTVHPPNGVFYVFDQEPVKYADVPCIKDTRVCFGGWDPSGRFWGRGFDGTRACDDCCVTCAGGRQTASHELDCY